MDTPTDAQITEKANFLRTLKDKKIKVVVRFNNHDLHYSGRLIDIGESTFVIEDWKEGTLMSEISAIVRIQEQK